MIHEHILYYKLFVFLIIFIFFSFFDQACDLRKISRGLKYYFLPFFNARSVKVAAPFLEQVCKWSPDIPLFFYRSGYIIVWRCLFLIKSSIYKRGDLFLFSAPTLIILEDWSTFLPQWPGKYILGQWLSHISV